MTDCSTKDTPRIYVACLAAYNAGRLHGEWIDADQDADVIHEEIQEMLAAMPDLCYLTTPRGAWRSLVARLTGG